jgi:hypothetical protein
MRPADSLDDSSGRRPDGANARARDVGGTVRASGEAFSHALRAAVVTGAFDTSALHAALRAFVDDMRDHAEPPERALIAVKECVLIAVQRREDISRAEASAVLRQIVHWTIEAYYRAD